MPQGFSEANVRAHFGLHWSDIIAAAAFERGVLTVTVDMLTPGRVKTITLAAAVHGGGR
jgi:hypothetical protein